MLLTVPGMRTSPPFSVGPIFLALLVGVTGTASCGSVTALAPDGGAAGTGGGAGHVTTGTAGAQAGTNGTAGSTQDGRAGAAGGSTNVDASVDREASCPATPVLPAGTCTPSQVCEYRASDAHPTCVTRLDCYASGTNTEPSWHLTQPDPSCDTHSASCPSTYAAGVQTGLAGIACSVQDSPACDYAEGRCSCLACASTDGSSPHGTWSCRAWDSGGTGCPAISPLAGTECDTPNQFCTYGGLCSVSVGDDLECKDGFWQQMISAAGSCILRTCPTMELNGGDTCFQAVGCSGGTCWEALDGANGCVTPVPTPTLTTCQPGDTTCCLKEADCTQSTTGRCLPLLDVRENFCGGAIPLGNVCRYDQCRSDADCTAQAPAGAAVSACVPSGAFGLYNATCVYGGCRTDADCGLYPGGSCQYGQAATNGVCSLRNVFFCAYPSDSCQVTNNTTTGCPSGKICVPKSNYQGRECGAPPPEYP